MANAPLTIRGAALAPAAHRPVFDVINDALLEIGPDGRIASFGPAPAGCRVAETRPGAIWLPGFVDSHVHYPQTRMVGSASGPLLEWLDRTTFPEEACFSEDAYAVAVAAEFCQHLARNGTTSAAIFSSPHPGATHRLFEALDAAGLRALAGLTLMDRGAPVENLLAAAPALEACAALVERWHGHDGGRLRFCITPRFAIACSPALLRGAADLAERHRLPIQTHLSENPDEIAYTRELYPDSADYLAVYADHGLVTDQSLFAHAIHLEDAEWDRLAAADAALAHCPDSNFFLGSGCMRLAHAHRRGLRVGIGTDVGAGRSFSVRRCAARGHDAARIVGEPVSAEALLWHATRGGARALGIGATVGTLAVGMQADLVALDAPDPDHRGDRFDALLHRLDYGPVVEARVGGAVVWSRPA